MERWRVIGPERLTLQRSLALEEVAMESVMKGGDPILRIWTWKGNSASIGRFQAMEEEIDIGYAKANSIVLVRRASGGGAVYNGDGDELAYSVISRKIYHASIEESYRNICAMVIEALATIGIRSRFEGPNRVMVGDRKISGNSKWLRGDVSLQHGTLLYRPNLERIEAILKTPNDNIGRGVRSIKTPVTGIWEHCPHISLEKISIVLRSAMTSGKLFYENSWEKDENSRAEELVKKKYGNGEWTFSL
jgi:lipoate-protein ligase A